MKCLVILAFVGKILLGTQWKKPLSVSTVSNQAVGAAKSFEKQIGVITENGRVLYYVVTKFYTVQAAIQLHGHSSVSFLDKNRVEAAKYLVDLPEELPEKVVGNALVFHCTNQAGKRSIPKQVIGAELPKWVCAGPNNCFQKQ